LKCIGITNQLFSIALNLIKSKTDLEMERI
jgi:hypothetical protein